MQLHREKAAGRARFAERTTANSANSANCVIPKRVVDRLLSGRGCRRVVRKTNKKNRAARGLRAVGGGTPREEDGGR